MNVFLNRGYQTPITDVFISANIPPEERAFRKLRLVPPAWVPWVWEISCREWTR